MDSFFQRGSSWAIRGVRNEKQRALERYVDTVCSDVILHLHPILRLTANSEELATLNNRAMALLG